MSPCVAPDGAEQSTVLIEPLPRRVIPETVVKSLYEYLDARKIVPEEVLGMPMPQAHGLGGVPIERWGPLLGIHLGQTITPRHLGVLGYVLHACENLGAALQRYDRYQRLAFDITPMTRQEFDSHMDLTWDVDKGAPRPLAETTAFAILVLFCRGLARAPFSPMLVQFMDPSPADLQPYLDYFGCPMVFEQAAPIVRLSTESLALPLRNPDPGMIRAMEMQAEQLLAQMPHEDAMMEDVRKVIARLLREGEPTMESMADSLHCATRTIQRRLTAAGSSFRQELAVVRRQMADTHMRDPRLGIADIALLLGYSEHSAFSRSYKAWTGITPEQQRTRWQAGPEGKSKARTVRKAG